MIAETISLGILALPKALAVLGLLPLVRPTSIYTVLSLIVRRGTLAIVGIGILSAYTALVLGQFKCHYRHVHSMADAGEIVAGRLGRELLAIAQLTFFIFVMGSHILTFSMMMNVLTDHATCTIVFSAVGLFVSIALTLPRRLERLSHLCMISFLSILLAVFITMAGVSPPYSSYNGAPMFSPVPTIHDACVAIANIIFAYAGHVAFFTLFSELKDVKEYPKAVILLHGVEIFLYTLTAIVIYVFVGPNVASPALNSAGRRFRKIAYGTAIPTIVIGGVVNAHVAVKCIYVRIFRRTSALHKRSFLANGSWIGICTVLWVISWIIAEAIPVFNDTLGLASSLFASWFSFGLCGIFWLYQHQHELWISWKQGLLSVVNITIAIIGFVMCVVGVYSSVVSIHRDLKNAISGGSFSCSDNA